MAERKDTMDGRPFINVYPDGDGHWATDDEWRELDPEGFAAAHEDGGR